MTSSKSAKKRSAKKRALAMATAKPKSKLAALPYSLAHKELNSFLALHVGEATDAYLRGLAAQVAMVKK
jgi:hypothetical protein